MRLLSDVVPEAWLYYGLYLATLLAYLVLIAYVMVGSSVMGAAALRGPRTEAHRALVDVARDWLPFALGAAITAGVAPLLFAQVLYRDALYTANLLLFTRWMAILPALIVGFYGLYAVKSGVIEERWPRLGRVAALVPIGCFVFVALSWVENHLLMIDDARWVGLYTEGPEPMSPAALPRLLVWVGLWGPTAAAIFGLQLRSLGHRAARSLSALALCGLGITFVGAAWLARVEPLSASAPAPGLFVAVGVSAGLCASAWAGMAWRGTLSVAGLASSMIAAVIMLLAVLLAREEVRLASVDLARLREHHAEIASGQGLVVFLLFLVVNAAVLVACVRMTRRQLR